jgi:hypothetical protein
MCNFKLTTSNIFLDFFPTQAQLLPSEVRTVYPKGVEIKSERLQGFGGTSSER